MNYNYLRLYTKSLRSRYVCLFFGMGWVKFGIPQFQLIAWLPSLRKTYLINSDSKWTCNDSKI